MYNIEGQFGSAVYSIQFAIEMSLLGIPVGPTGMGFAKLVSWE